MASGTFYPGTGTDDGHWYSSYFYNTYDDVGFGDNSGNDRNAYFRFQNITIPQGATISSAYVKLTAKDSKTDDIEIRIYANDVDDSVSPTSAATANALVKTTAYADWSITTDWVAGTQYDTPSLTAIIQEIVNRPGWSSGNSTTILLIDNGTSSVNAHQKASSYEYDSGSEKAELHVEWEIGVNVSATTATMTVTTHSAAVGTPVSGTFYPAVSGDDGYWFGTSFTSTDIGLWLGNVSGNNENIYIRFPDITIPKGSTITSALLRLTSYTSRSSETVNVNIYANAADDATAPASTAEGNSLSLTDSIPWNAISAWTNPNQYDSPSLISIIQDVIDRPGWTFENALMLVLKDNNSDTSASRVAFSFNYDSGSAKPELHIEYVLPDVNVETVAELLVITPNAATIKFDNNVIVNTGSLAITPNVTDVSFVLAITASLAALSVTPYRANIPETISCTTPPLAITPNTAGVYLGTFVNSSLVGLAISTYATTVRSEIPISGTMDLVNCIKFGSALVLSNSLNIVLSSNISTVNGILQNINGELGLKISIEEKVKIIDTVIILNRILGTDGISQYNYEFSKGHGL